MKAANIIHRRSMTCRRAAREAAAPAAGDQRPFISPMARDKPSRRAAKLYRLAGDRIDAACRRSILRREINTPGRNDICAIISKFHFTQHRGQQAIGRNGCRRRRHFARGRARNGAAPPISRCHARNVMMKWPTPATLAADQPAAMQAHAELRILLAAAAQPPTSASIGNQRRQTMAASSRGELLFNIAHHRQGNCIVPFSMARPRP